jgi:hypothetical protein
LFYAKDADVLVVAQRKLPQIFPHKPGVAKNSVTQGGESRKVYKPRIQLNASASESNFCRGHDYSAITTANIQERFIPTGSFFG